MTLGRRQVMLTSLELGVAVATGPRIASAREAEVPQPFSTYGASCRAAPSIKQRRCRKRPMLQRSQARLLSFRPGFRRRAASPSNPAPTFKTLRASPSSAIATILSVDAADDVRLDGLVLDGAGKALGDGGALLVATASKHLDISDWRFLSTGGDGVSAPGRGWADQRLRDRRHRQGRTVQRGRGRA